jgi:hypothetical protein
MPESPSWSNLQLFFVAKRADDHNFICNARRNISSHGRVHRDIAGGRVWFDFSIDSSSSSRLGAKAIVINRKSLACGLRRNRNNNGRFGRRLRRRK